MEEKAKASEESAERATANVNANKKMNDDGRAANVAADEKKRAEEEKARSAQELLEARAKAKAEKHEREMQEKIDETKAALDRKIKWLNKYG